MLLALGEEQESRRAIRTRLKGPGTVESLGAEVAGGEQAPRAHIRVSDLEATEERGQVLPCTRALGEMALLGTAAFMKGVSGTQGPEESREAEENLQEGRC